MPLTPGTRLGVYEITAQIGVGGMGEVYRATDTNLKRLVAIKVLPASVAGDADRLARFQREAEVLAALNYPNIAAIYGLEKTPDFTALVMELVEGDDLSQRIAHGAIPIDEALPIAKQIAEALEAAHEQGIIHRDLKPANIKVRSDGTVKVLDFGLAKAIEPPASSPNVSQSPTITTPAMTQAGMILGTAAYMSPEQAKGRPADKRSDIWTFGCVLYEMITGKRAFEGEDVSETLAFILTKEAHWNGLPTTTPRPIRTLLRRSLEKDRRRRLDSAADARLEIEDALTAPAAEVALSAVAPRRSRERLAWMSALVVALIAVVAVVWPGRPVPAGRVSRFVITTPPSAPIRGGNQRGVAISPDGSRLVYRSAPESTGLAGVLYLRGIDQLAVMPLHGADGAVDPVFSRDGTTIVYGDIRANALKRMAVDGGPPVTICSLEGGNPRGASWGPDDMIVFATDRSKGLLRVPAAGGTPTRLTAVDPGKGELEHAWPDVLPDGRGVLFTVSNGFPEEERVAVVALPTGQVTSLFAGTSPRFVPTGHVLFGLADGTLRAVGFDARRLQVLGNPVTMAEHVGISPYGAARFAVADEGSLVYSTEAQLTVPRTLVWVNRKGQEEPIPVPPRAYTYARLSPDETHVALDSRDEQNDVWIWDLMRQTLQRLTKDPGMNRMPVWTPDSQKVAFTAVRDGVESVYWQAFDGSGTMERLSSGTQNQAPISFSPDASQLIFSTPLIGPYRLGVLGVRTHTATMLLNSTASETNGEISPDGHWLAYESDESGQTEIYVRPFPNVETAQRPVSTGGGTRPLWSRDGRELFYYVAPDTIMAVPVRLGADVVMGNPQLVVKGPHVTITASGRHYDVSADGQKFLLLKDAPTPDGQKTATPEIHLVLSWFEELKARVPTGK